VLRRHLLERVREHGPIYFDEFMDAALYDPRYGYFASGPLRSAKEGDFLTSPEVSPLFGATLAAFVGAEAERIGADPVTVVEAGGGSGSLLRPLIDELEAAADLWAVEVSPAARRHLAAQVPEAATVGSLEEIPGPVRGVVIANELLDNLPAAVAVRRGDSWEELLVGAEGDELRPVSGPARRQVARWAQAYGGPVADGGRIEVQLAAGAWLRGALGLVEAGAVMVADYGDSAEGLAARRAEGTIRTYRGHHLGPDPLADPGNVDITMDVDFSALEAVAREAGARAEVVRQAAFLERWGLGRRIESMRERERRLARDGNAMERLRVRSEITNAETLLHPRGLGDFRVLVAEVG
jgi:SAM-dependent MidA family methyltransferase